MIQRTSLVLAGVTLTLLAVALPARAGKVGPGGARAKSGSLVCPVMKAPVKDIAKAPHLMVNNAAVYVCCPGCTTSIKKEPARYLNSALKDPVTGKPFRVTGKTPRLEHQGALFLFSGSATRVAFQKNPAKYARSSEHAHGEHSGHSAH